MLAKAHSFLIAPTRVDHLRKAFGSDANSWLMPSSSRRSLSTSEKDHPKATATATANATQHPHTRPQVRPQAQARTQTRPQTLSPLNLLQNDLMQNQPLQAVERLESLSRRSIEAGISSQTEQKRPATHLLPNYTTATLVHRLIRVLCREGHLPQAEKTLDLLPPLQISPLPATYAVLIAAHGKAGHLDRAALLFRRAQSYVNQRLARKDAEIMAAAAQDYDFVWDAIHTTASSSAQHLPSDSTQPKPASSGSARQDPTASSRSDSMNHQDGVANHANTNYPDLNASKRSGNIPWKQKHSKQEGIEDTTTSHDAYRLDPSVLSTQSSRGAVHHATLYTAIISAYINNRNTRQALDYLREMEFQNIKPNAATYAVLIQACTQEGDLPGAQRILREMEEDGIHPDIVVYNNIMDMAIKRKKPQLLLTLLRNIKKTGIVFSAHTYSMFLLPCARSGEVGVAMSIIKMIRDANEVVDIYHYSLCLEATTVLGDVRTARAILDDIRADGLVPTDRCLTYAVRAFAKGGEPQMAQEMLLKMQAQGIKPSHFFFNAVLYAWTNYGDIEQAKKIIALMKANSVPPNKYSYNMLLNAFCKHGSRQHLDEAVALINDMKRANMEPDQHSFYYLLRMMARLDEQAGLRQYFLECPPLPLFNISIIFKYLSRHNATNTMAFIIDLLSNNTYKGIKPAYLSKQSKANSTDSGQFIHNQILADDYFADANPKPEFDLPRWDIALEPLDRPSRYLEILGWVYSSITLPQRVEIVSTFHKQDQKLGSLLAGYILQTEATPGNYVGLVGSMRWIAKAKISCPASAIENIIDDWKRKQMI
eukprot:TRINITY_DN532_c0_g3_i1.p1 TRINITY_DN532_c0_g3~~TRINITY_DN532_c0_g3_i1.p1  ORF type:complete len:822 (+),score=171.80 TRINITY_DN532_c0_g3_i1:100-2565(+)